MRYLKITLLILVCNSCIAISPKEEGSGKPISHDQWTELLQKYIHGNKVDYKGFIQDSVKLNEYLRLLETNHPNQENWTKIEQLAYWINAYNAFTIRIVIRNHPLSSIRDIAGAIPFINSVWDIKFIRIAEETYDLNNIEHGVLRSQFQEPRIHFAINCASVSCPTLRNEAYVADKLEAQLQEQTLLFLKDESKNQIEFNKLELSKIFRWFGGDFEKGENSKEDFIKEQLGIELSDEVKLEYRDYDWSLNE